MSSQIKGASLGLPRLLYIGDVPVEASYHGSALLYRLLEDYPSEKLLIIEGNLHRSETERRLKNVAYDVLAVGWERLLRTRLHRYYSAFLTIFASHRKRLIGRLVSDFAPEAVLTVSHGYSWITAHKFALDEKLPLHLICHDDWPGIALVPSWFHSRLHAEFAGVYHQASSRLCVSPAMREAYRQRYGVDADILFPCRSSETIMYNSPPTGLARGDHRFVVAFAGTINNADCLHALQTVVHALEESGGRLLIFGPVTAEALKRNELERPSVLLQGLVSPNELIKRLRDEADVLFVPMSFDTTDRNGAELSFPSKLADYTAAGLPLLIYGPPYCSAVRWAEENPGVAEVATSQAAGSLSEVLGRLMSDSAHRWMLGKRALEVGERDFSARKARELFYRAVCGSTSVS